jgi:hypothetical protein
MICTEIKTVRNFPISACDGEITFYYIPADVAPSDVYLQLQDRHGNQYQIQPIDINTGQPYYTATFSFADFPEKFVSQTGRYLMRLLNSVYCFNGIVPIDCADPETLESFETLEFGFGQPELSTWQILLR